MPLEPMDDVEIVFACTHVCPTCRHASHEFCTVRADVQHAVMECGRYEVSASAAKRFAASLESLASPLAGVVCGPHVAAHLLPGPLHQPLRMKLGHFA